MGNGGMGDGRRAKGRGHTKIPCWSAQEDKIAGILNHFNATKDFIDCHEVKKLTGLNSLFVHIVIDLEMADLDTPISQPMRPALDSYGPAGMTGKAAQSA
jgi:hypothetical protein